MGGGVAVHELDAAGARHGLEVWFLRGHVH